MTSATNDQATPTGIFSIPGHSLAKRVATVLMALAIACTAKAASYTWTGAADDLWSTSANWSPAGVPGTGDEVTFDYGDALVTEGIT